MADNPVPVLTVEQYRSLLADWFVKICTDRGIPFPQRGRSGDSLTFTSTDELHVTAQFTDSPPYLHFTASDNSRTDLMNVAVGDAIKNIEQGNFGEAVWYSTTLLEPEHTIQAYSMLSFVLMNLGDKL